MSKRKSTREHESRINQLRVEVSRETNSDSPNPAEIGWREVEIELTCRMIDAETKTLGEKNVALLSDAQKARLKTLDEALKLASTISNAQQLGMLPGGLYPAYSFTYTYSFTDAGSSLILLGSRSPALSACGPRLPTVTERMGDLRP